MLRIETRLETPAEVLFHLTGTISGEHLVMLERLLDDAFESGRRVGLDLGAVTLADREAVEFLARRTSRGVVLERCPAFLREWISRETEQAAHVRPGGPAQKPRTSRDQGSRVAQTRRGERT